MLGFFLHQLTTSALAATVYVGMDESIQTAMNDASPGDTIVLAAGTYTEDLSTEVSGTEDAPITVMSGDDGRATITALGEVLQVDHPHWIFENIVFDGQFGDSDTIDINDGADHTRLSNVVVQRSSRDCIDMGAPSHVRIIDSEIHSCLWFDGDEEEPRDAHGITGGAVQHLSIIDTAIHAVSGDAIQFDPGRSSPGWTGIVIQGCRLFAEPLTEDTNGFRTGQTPGDNAIDTKTNPEAERATLVIEDTVVRGFSDGIGVSDQAALFIKEGVDATIRRTVVRDSSIGFRIRGPTSARPEGAHVRIENTVLHDLDVGIQFEDDVAELTVLHTTFGVNIATPLVEVSSTATDHVIQNSLFTTPSLPSFALESAGNRATTTDQFVSSDSRNHRLTSASVAIDAGIEIAEITTDFDELDRWIGMAPDAGAFEFGQDVAVDTGGTDDTGFVDTAEPDNDTADPATTEPDAPVEPGEPGIGAAERVGEQGGCGCSSNPRLRNGLPWVFLSLLLVFRSRRGLYRTP